MLRVTQRIARRSGEQVSHRRAGDRVPRDRRAGAAGAAAGDARRQRAGDGALARRRRLRADRVGDRPLLADRREPGRDPPRLERGHHRLPLDREGERADDDVLEAGRLRRDRGSPLDGRRAPARRRRQPRQPALGRGRPPDPDRQPPLRGEALEPRLPRLLRERVQRHARARPLLLRGDPRVVGGDPERAARRPAPRPSRRHLPVHARGDVRDRPRPDRLRRDLGHDARAARGLRDVLELRRGGAPLGARALGHARGAAEARPAVRPDRARAPVRGAAVRDRRPLRPRPDAGRDLPAAERLRPGRPRRPLARERHGATARLRRRDTTPWSGTR